jgi:aminoglycoside 3-N-acetyltransferase
MNNPHPLDQAAIETGLRALGLGPGDAVEVHSSLRSLGPVDGGAETVIAALMDVVGPEGAIVMSAYPVSPAIPLTPEDRARGITWKVRILPEGSLEKTGMGAIADAFASRPDVLLGTGLHRVATWGRDAERHRLGYRHLVAIGGWTLLVGVGIDRCSSMHLVDHLIPQGISRIFQVPEDILADYPASLWSIGYGDTPDDAWAKVWEQARRQGLVNQGRIGNAECSLFRARAMLGIYEASLRADAMGLFGITE